MQQADIEKLREWFLSQKRDLPWRENTSPYAVWVSEVMLQQTQVAVVIPYFQRWMEKFPSIEVLATAPIEEVTKEWEGLGYYARARNLHEGARYVVEKYGGELPSSSEELSKIKGLGPYTIGAIQNFAFRKRAAAVDGNVLRVLARYYALENDIGKAKTIKLVQEMAYELLPNHEPWIISEALIELGATICTRDQKCHECPLRNSCKGYLMGKASDLPVKSQKKPTISIFRGVPIVYFKGKFLVLRAEKGKIMEGLYQFPYFENEKSKIEIEAYEKWLKDELGVEGEWKMSLCQVRHTFTRYRALLFPEVFEVKKQCILGDYEWHSLDGLKKLPFSSGHKRILNCLSR